MNTNNDIARIERLMTEQTGDEKHDDSAHSTLDVIWVLYDRILRYDPKNPRSQGRDRFVLSKGHGPEALYAVLADKGFFPISELKTFMQWDSMLGSHPDRNKVPGVEASTGSLGHGLPMGVGMALGLRIKKSDRKVIVLIGDGECNEGSIWEAILLAGAALEPVLLSTTTQARSISVTSPPNSSLSAGPPQPLMAAPTSKYTRRFPIPITLAPQQ